MNVLARIRAGGREIEYAIATTMDERAAVLAQRFRVYQRRGYYQLGLQVDRDVHDDKAAYFLATLPDGDLGSMLLGSMRVIIGESSANFCFPSEKSFEFELPAAIRDMAMSQRVEISRVVAEATRGVVIGGLLVPLGLIQATAEHTRPLDVRAGQATIKLRLLRALQGLGVRLHEIHPARLIYPIDGPVSRYFYHHTEPVVPAWWLTDEIAPSIERAIASYGSAKR